MRCRLSPFLLALATTAVAAPRVAAQAARVAVATEGENLVVRLGPVRLPANAGHDGISQLALQTWRMPRGGHLRGYRVEIVDRAGNVLPSQILHHAELVDLGRRDLLRVAYNRVASAGKETSALLLPPGMGYPVAAGQELGINAMLHNPTGTTYAEAFVRATITLTPDGAQPAPRPVLGFYAETGSDGSGDSSFDLPPGRSVQVVEFEVPVAGTILAVGGHLHDFGTRMVVTRAGGADTLYAASPRTDSTGAVTGMPRVLFFGRTVRAAPGERFVMRVEYDNTSGSALPRAGMGTFGVVFAPDDLAAWPALEPRDPRVQRDLAGLRSPHQHPMPQGTHRH